MRASYPVSCLGCFLLSFRGWILVNSPSEQPAQACPDATMPVHSREKKEGNHEEMEVDFPDQDGSSTDEEDTVSSSVSEDGDSSGRKK